VNEQSFVSSTWRGICRSGMLWIVCIGSRNLLLHSSTPVLRWKPKDLMVVHNSTIGFGLFVGMVFPA
jgi:hypothetical protein